MQVVTGILVHTPLWVWGLLALLIWLGTLSLQPRSQPLRRLLIVPAVFFLMGLSRLVLGGKSIELVAVWLVSAALLAALALYVGPRHVTIDPATGYIRRPGSVLPLVRNIVIFLLQYAVAVTTAMKLDIGIDVAMVGQAVSGPARAISWAGRSRCCAPTGRRMQSWQRPEPYLWACPGALLQRRATGDKPCAYPHISDGLPS